MISTAIWKQAEAYASDSTITFANLRRYIELLAEDTDRAATARLGNVALDSVPRVSRYMDVECSAVARTIWATLRTLSPTSFFNGKIYSEGLKDYEAHLRSGGNGAYNR